MDRTPLTDREIDYIVEVVARRVEKQIQEKYGADLTFSHRERVRAAERDGSKRRIVETITGTAGAVGLLGFLGWLGAVIIHTIREIVQSGT